MKNLVKDSGRLLENSDILYRRPQKHHQNAQGIRRPEYGDGVNEVIDRVIEQILLACRSW